MRLHWVGLITGGLGVGLALVPGLMPHTEDSRILLLSGMLVVSSSILGFDLPFPRNQIIVMTILIGSLIFIGGVLMVMAGHTSMLYVICFPSSGLILYGSREVLKGEK
jgi:hypothetical protein